MEWATDLEMYREVLRAEGIGVARWDIKLDRVFGDAAMMMLFPNHLTNGPYSEFLLRRPELHPNDVKFFEALVRFVQSPHHEYAGKTHEIVVEFRLTDAGNHEQWFHAHYTIHFEREWPRSAVLLLRSTDSEHKSEETLRQKADRATRAMLAKSENEETKNCYKVRTDTNRPCARCEYAELHANCPGAVPLREEAERRGLIPIPIRWNEGLDGHLYLLDT